MIRQSSLSRIGFQNLVAWILFLSMNVCPVSQSLRGTQVESPEWIVKVGDKNYFRITGQVVGADSMVATDYELQVTKSVRDDKQQFPVTRVGDEFEVRIPMDNGLQFNLTFFATSPDGRSFANRILQACELRQAALQGLRLRLQPASRSIEVNVMQDGNPVPGASVRALWSDGRESSEVTANEKGTVTLAAREEEKLIQLWAWAEDYRVGGFSFYDSHSKDPLADHHSIELSSCNPKTIRIVDEENKPLAGVKFRVFVSDRSPERRSFGDVPGDIVESGEDGEAVCRWYPDWKSCRHFVHPIDGQWVKLDDPDNIGEADKVVDNVIVVPLKRGQSKGRQRIAGRISFREGKAQDCLAGVFIEASTFQGEFGGGSDRQVAFTDEQGRFEIDYVSGSTYCLFINDLQYVSKAIDLIPFDPQTGKETEPLLDVFAGSPVEIIVTSGPYRKPIANQGVSLRSEYRYSWLENSRTQHGADGRGQSFQTDASGKVYFHAAAGETVTASVYSNDWRVTEKIEVRNEGTNTIVFHKPHNRTVRCKLVLPAGLEANIAGAKVIAGSIDGEKVERNETVADKDGNFSLESAASEVCILVETTDGKASAVAKISDPISPLFEVSLRPTGSLQGLLLGEGDQPLAGQAVRAILTVFGNSDDTGKTAGRFKVREFETTTGTDGRYTLTGLPVETKLSLRAGSMDRNGFDKSLHDIFLIAGEVRTEKVHRIGLPVMDNTKRALADRFATGLRDCKLNDYRLIVFLHQQDDDQAADFIHRNFLDDRAFPDLYNFMQLVVAVDRKQSNPEPGLFIAEKDWLVPEPGSVFACIYDGTGAELGRIELSSGKGTDNDRAIEFVTRHAVPKKDAKKAWDVAFEEAARTNRKVWVRISGRHCGPCFLLTRWMDDHKTLLEKDYVMLKIDRGQDEHGLPVSDFLLQNSTSFGIPFHGIFDAEQKLVIDSEGPIGNIGFPGSFEGIKHLRKMMTETRTTLIDEEITGILPK